MKEKIDIIETAIKEAKSAEKTRSGYYVFFVLFSIVLGIGWLSYALITINKKDDLLKNAELLVDQKEALIAERDSLVAVIRKINFDTSLLAEERQDLITTELREEENTEGAKSWAIIFSANNDLDAAKWEINRAAKIGVDNATVYYRNEKYRSIVILFTRTEADQVLEKIKSEISPSAYLVDMNKWCPVSEVNGSGEFYECK